MKTPVLTIAALAAFAAPALAMGTAEKAAVDANGDGLLTIEEMQAAYPDITAETFSAMDANDDGALDDDELSVAEEAGVPAPKDG